MQNTEGKTLILVDDDASLRTTLALAFRDSGFRVIECGDGAEAWGELSKTQPSAVLTGIKMPGMTGFELLTKIKNTPQLAHIPVFILSHQGLEKDHKKAKTLGAAGFFAKGFVTPREMISELSEIS